MSPVKTAPAALTAVDAAAAHAVPRRGARPALPAPCRRTGGHRDRRVPGRPGRPPAAAAGAGRRRAGSPPPRSAGTPSRSPGRASSSATRWSAALRTGASGVLLRDRIRSPDRLGRRIDGLPARARSGRDLRLSVHIGPARANRKPVLQLLTPGRRARSASPSSARRPLTRRLVRAETAALPRWPTAGLTKLTGAAGAARRAVARLRGAGPVGAAGLAAAARR